MLHCPDLYSVSCYYDDCDYEQRWTDDEEFLSQYALTWIKTYHKETSNMLWKSTRNVFFQKYQCRTDKQRGGNAIFSKVKAEIVINKYAVEVRIASSLFPQRIPPISRSATPFSVCFALHSFIYFFPLTPLSTFYTCVSSLIPHGSIPHLCQCIRFVQIQPDISAAEIILSIAEPFNDINTHLLLTVFASASKIPGLSSRERKLGVSV